MQIPVNDALEKLKNSGKVFTELFAYGTLVVEFYKPDKLDHQKPHSRDEIYVITSGEGDFFNDGKITPFKTGDFLFAKAGVEHRFLNFSPDFTTWVFFYGPEGGEKS